MDNVESKMTGGTEDDQKKNGTFQTQFQRLRLQLRDLTEGGVDPKDVEEVFMTLLRGFENQRLSHQRNIRKLERQIEWERAQEHACSQHAALMLGTIGVQITRKQSGQAAMPSDTPQDRISDTELLKTICICGCQDEEDAADCDCPCHTDKGYCENPKCSVCPPKKEEAEKISKKKPTRKPRAKKSTAKK